MDDVKARSDLLGIYGIIFGIISLIISISIATIIFLKTSSESEENKKDLQKFTKLSLLLHDGNNYYNTQDYKNAKK